MPMAKASRRQRHGATRRLEARGGRWRSRRGFDAWLDRLVSGAVLTALLVGVLALLVTLIWG
nr:hypothetical protein [Chromohalobacter sp.]